jgi:hypothetical protein
MNVSVFAVGDVFVDAEDGLAPFAPMQSALERAGIVFGNCEGVYSDRPARSPTHKHFMGAPVERGRRLGEVPFHVMTLANNHIVDGGYIGLRDTIDLLRAQGVAVTGAGNDIAAAIAPAVLERDGIRVAFLGFCSVFPVGYEARMNRPGIAALRVHTSYVDPDRNFWEPGIPPRVITTPDVEDLERFRTAIAAARDAADHVVVACHWGYSSLLEALQEYELTLAREAVLAGADAVVCHHHHSLRGIEIFRKRPIFFGLGAFVHHLNDEIDPSVRAARETQLGRRSLLRAAEAYPSFPFCAEARRTGIATLDFDGNGGVTAGLIPGLINPDGSTEPLPAGDPRGAAIIDYVEELSDTAGLSTQFTRGTRDGWTHVAVA